MMHQEYIEREIIKETEKAYLVKQEINNPRDGMHIKYRWVAKSQCKPVSEETQKLYDAIPDEFKQFVNKKVNVPEWLVSNGVWGR